MNPALLSSDNLNWCTPEEELDVIYQLDKIGLDPCSNPQSIVESDFKFTLPYQDGLMESWTGYGLVFVNPPYSRQVPQWACKAALQARGMTGRDSILMLIPSRTDTKWFQQYVFGTANAICFRKGRIQFVGAEHPAPFPSAYIYWGNDVSKFESIFSPRGHVVVLR